MSANFTPTRGDYNDLKPFRFWCQKILPLVYDDSLSYYELLCKVVDYLNKTMEDVDTLEGDITSMYAAYDQLQSYVNSYFDNLDVQEEINNKLDKMVADGTLVSMLQPTIASNVTSWLNENVVQETGYVIDDSLTVTNAAADAKVTGDAIRLIKGEVVNILDENNLFVNPVAYVTGAYYDSTARPNSDYAYYILALTADTAYTCRGVRFISDGTEIVLNNESPEYIATFTPESSGNYYVSTKNTATERIHFFTTTRNYNDGNYGTNEQPVLATHVVEDIVNGVAKYEHVNFADPAGFTLNHYLGNDGSSGSNSSYFYTDYIEVNEGEEYSFNKARFVTAYDETKTVRTNDGVNDANIGCVYYKVPANVKYMRITGKTADVDQFMVNRGNVLLKYVPYNAVDLIGDYETVKRSFIANSAAGALMVENNAASLNSGAIIYIDDFPQNLKNGNIIGGYCEFQSFTGLSIGKGYDTYRGDWVYIGSTNVHHYHFEQSSSVVESKPHGITIADYLDVYIDIQDDGTAVVNLNSTGGTAQLEFDFAHEQNGKPFMGGSQAMTNVHLSAVASKAKCPVWLIGDSFLGYTIDRVMGQVELLGYSDKLMVDGVAGQGSQQAWREITNLVKGGNVPKVLVWYLGMNDNTETYTTYLAKVVDLCKQYNITLVINDTPTTPAVDNEAKHTLVNTYKSAGYRIVNSYQIVGTSSNGTWRTGYIAADNTHPSPLGAKALAMALLTSVPEIAQF